MRSLEIRSQRIFNNLIKQNQKLASDFVLKQSEIVYSAQSPTSSIESPESSVHSPASRVQRPESSNSNILNFFRVFFPSFNMKPTDVFDFRIFHQVFGSQGQDFFSKSINLFFSSRPRVFLYNRPHNCFLESDILKYLPQLLQMNFKNMESFHSTFKTECLCFEFLRTELNIVY